MACIRTGRFLLPFTLAIGLAVNGHSQSSLTNGLVAYYPFNGNAKDESGNGDNGVVLQATLTADRFGQSGKAYWINGTSQAGIQTAGTFLPTGSQPRTISLWLKPDQLITNMAQTWISGGLVQYGTGNAGGSLFQAQFVWQSSPGLVSFYLGTENVWGWNSWMSNWNFSRWHHAVWTIDGSTNAFLYVDGQKATFESSSTGVLFNTQSGPLFIGAAGGRYFTGCLDDVRIYNRALSPSEVAQLYALESPNALNEGLVAYYPLNGNTEDATGNGDMASGVNTEFSVDRFGISNRSIFLNGNNAVLTVARPLIDLGQDYTLSLWFSSQDVSKKQQFLVGSTGGFWGLAIDYNDPPSTPPGVINWAVGTGPTASGWSAGYVYGSQSPYLSSHWYHVVFKRNQHDYKMFVNGSLVSQQIVDIDFAYTPSGWEFGADTYWQSAWLKGNLDDIRIYNRALSDAEVWQLFVTESGPRVDLIKAVKPSFSGLLIGTDYQLQVSADMKAWTNSGSPFTATNSSMVYPQYWDVENWGGLFFRVKTSP
jgi:hypothetical protein